MLEPIKFILKTNDGKTITGQIELPDQIAIERNFDCSVLYLFSEHSGERLTYGAWHYLRRTKKIADTTEFDPFVNTLVELKDSASDPEAFEEPDEDPKGEETAALPAQ